MLFIYKCYTINNENKNLNNFIKYICQSYSLLQLALKENNPKKISQYIHMIGYNFVFLSDFIKIICWYIYNIEKYGNESDLLDVIKYYKDVIKFYPRTPYLFFITKKTYEYLEKNSFTNYEMDFSHFVEFLNNLLLELKNYFSPNNIEILSKFQDILNNKKNNYFVNNIINNLQSQFILSLNMSQNIINNNDYDDNIKILCLSIMIFYFHTLKITCLKEKYINIIKIKYPNDYQMFIDYFNIN